MKKVSCVIMDWAGTAVDFGCFAPLNAFLRVFQEQGVTITYRPAREPMGLLKIEHIKAILKMPEVSERFRIALPAPAPHSSRSPSAWPGWRGTD